MVARYVRDVEVAGSNPASPTNNLASELTLYNDVLCHMLEPNYELGPASTIKPDALGTPGQRQFRLLVEAERGFACLWLEKEQLLQLGITIKQLIAQAPGTTLVPETDTKPLSDTPLTAEASWEFKVNALTLGHDAYRNLFSIVVQPLDTDEDELPFLRFWATQTQMNSLAEEAFEICASGRPLCQICGIPLNSNEPHTCRRRNGHNPMGQWT